MKRFITMVSMLALAAGCEAAKSGGSADAGAQSDVPASKDGLVAGDEGGPPPPDGSRIGEDALPDANVAWADTAGGDTMAAEIASDGGAVGEVSLPVSRTYEDLCGGYCSALIQCSATSDDYDTCYTKCLSTVVGVPQDIARAGCVKDSGENCAEVAFCMARDVFQMLDQCNVLCSKAANCGLIGVFELPEEKELCAAQCSGSFSKAGGDAIDILDCMNEALSDDCDVGTMLDCLPGEESKICSGYCGKASVCPGLYSGPDECTQTCEAFEFWQEVASDMCLNINGLESGDEPNCEGAVACLTPPGEVPAGCIPYCDALTGLCPDVIPQGDFCTGFCAGVVTAIPGADAAKAAECTAALDACPQFENGEFLFCFLETDPECGAICDQILACGAETTPEECAMNCSLAKTSQPEVLEMVKACLAAAGDDCDAALACIPDEGPQQ